MGEARRREHQIGPHPVLDAFYLDKMPGQEGPPEVYLVLSCWDHDHPERDPLVSIIKCPSRAEAEAMERMARKANTPEKIARRGRVDLVDMGAKIEAGIREWAEAEARRIIYEAVPQAPAVH